jgi:hypothetical protein
MKEAKIKRKIVKLRYKIEITTVKASYMKEIGKVSSAWKQELKVQKYILKIKTLEDKLATGINNIQSISKKKRLSAQERTVLAEFLNSVVDLYIPPQIESGTSSEVIINLKNNSNYDLENLSIDLSDLGNYFNIDPVVQFPSMRIGMCIEKRIKFSPKHGDGIYPVIAKISGNGITVERPFTIKVGGTEIY